MKIGSSLNLTRRSFILGGSATLGAAAFALSGCKAKKSTPDSMDVPIVAAMSYQETNCNPIGQSSALFYAAGLHVLEGLYEIDFTTYKTYNGLAALAPKKINEYTYDVVIRDGAKFSTGEPVTVNDVVNAFNLNMQDDTYFSLLNFIKTVSATNDKTVTFTLNYPFESLLKERLAIVRIFPAKMTSEQLNTNPVGSGPWAYKNINGNDGGVIEFVKNDYYNGKNVANNANMQWNIITDDDARSQAIEQKTVQAIERVPESNVDDIKKSGANVEYVQSFLCPLMFFNCIKPPFDDVRVRQALMYAINYDKLIEDELKGHASAATCFLPKNHQNYHRATTVYTYNTQKAKELLNAAGLNRVAFTLLVNNTWVKSLASQIKSDLYAAGFDATINVQRVQWNSITSYDGVPAYDVLLTGGDPTQKGNDPDLCMQTWLGDNVWTKARTCWQRAQNSKFAELQAMMQKAKEAQGTPQQTFWNNCFDIIAEQCVTYPLFHREVATGYLSDCLLDFNPISTTGLIFLGATAQQTESR